jgi:hypothetical protein
VIASAVVRYVIERSVVAIAVSGGRATADLLNPVTALCDSEESNGRRKRG